MANASMALVAASLDGLVQHAWFVIAQIFARDAAFATMVPVNASVAGEGKIVDRESTRSMLLAQPAALMPATTRVQMFSSWKARSMEPNVI